MARSISNFVAKCISAAAWRIMRFSKVITDLQEWLNIDWLSKRVTAFRVRGPIAENYGNFPIEKPWARGAGGFEPRYVYEITDAELEMQSGLVAVDGWLVAESIGDHHNAGCLSFVWRLCRPLCKMLHLFEKLPENECFTYLRYDGYFHFVMESFVRLLYALKVRPESIVLVEETHYNGFYKGYVDLLVDLGVIKQLRVVDNRFLRIPRLVVAAAEEDAGMFCRESVDLIRSVLLGKVPGEKSIAMKIFVTRKGRRRFDNQEELEQIAREKGYEVVETEGMSVSDQIRLYQSARVIASNHGAGLTNILFASRGAKVVELFSPKWLNDCYFRMAKICEFDYKCLIADESGEWGRINCSEFESVLS